MNENRLYIPIDNVEIRTAKGKTGKYSIKGKAKLIPGKKYSYFFKQDQAGNPLGSLKEVFSESGWNKIKRKILSKNVFVDENHKTVAAMNVDRFLNDLARETGKDLKEFKAKIKNWMKVSDMPLFKLEDVELNDDSIEMDISMNPYFRDVDTEHAAYFDATWNSLQEKYINSISLNFKPTDVTDTVDDSGNYMPIINDMDIYGVSLLAGPAHDDMYDVLDVAIRAAQSGEEEGNMTKEKEKEITEKVTEKVKEDLKKEDLEKEIADLKKKNEENEKVLKAKADEEEEKEKENLIAEKERLQAELEEQNKKLQEHTPSKGLTPSGPLGNYEQRDQIRKVLKEVEDNSQTKLAHAIQLQAEFNANQTLPPESLALLRNKKADMVAPRNV